MLVFLAALLAAAGLLLYRHTHCSAPRPKQSSQLVTRPLQGEAASWHHLYHFVKILNNMSLKCHNQCVILLSQPHNILSFANGTKSGNMTYCCHNGHLTLYLRTITPCVCVQARRTS